MHDIGKTLDYKIEGSHAVISGDYADRFGESREICDTCMSHHNDLVLETPMSYVLKTADTLSGARPGARVNLEEGYQIRLNAIDDAVRSFRGIGKVAIMNGGREVHVEVNHKKVSESELSDLVGSIARKIEEDVAFPGQIKVLVSRKFEVSSVA
jgi:ribonuclease Y